MNVCVKHDEFSRLNVAETTMEPSGALPGGIEVSKLMNLVFKMMNLVFKIDESRI